MGGKQSAEGKSWEIPGEYKPVGDNAGCSGGHKNLQEALFGCLWVRGKVEQQAEKTRLYIMCHMMNKDLEI